MSTVIELDVPGERGAAHGRNIARLIMKTMFNFDVIDAELAPKAGAAIFAANHTGMLDGAVLLGAAPRPVHCLAKSELFEPPVDKLLNGAGQIPLDYESADRIAISRALAILQRGDALGIFPEAHRGLGRFATMRHGVAYFHVRTRAPIVPVAILGTRTTGKGKDSTPPLRSRIAVVFGKPFSPVITGETWSRSAISGLGEAIRQRLADHVDSAVVATGIELPTDDTSLATLEKLKANRSK